MWRQIWGALTGEGSERPRSEESETTEQSGGASSAAGGPVTPVRAREALNAEFSFTADGEEDEEDDSQNTGVLSRKASTSTRRSVDDLMYNIDAFRSHRASIGFERWGRDSLVAALRQAGAKIPERATKAELVQLARQRFDHRSMSSTGRPILSATARRISANRNSSNRSESTLPEIGDGQRVRYTSRRTGIKYVQSDRHRERRPSVPEEGLLIYPDEEAASSMDGLIIAPPASFRSLESLNEDEFREELQQLAHEFEEEGIETTLSQSQQAELEAQMRAEFDRPSRENARHFAGLHHPRNRLGKQYPICATSSGFHCPKLGWLGDLVYCGSSPDSELTRFGSGVSLYFKWLKAMLNLFFLLSVVQSPLIGINMSAYAGDFTGVGFFEATTLGSIASLDVNRTFVLLDDAVQPFVDCDGPCRERRTGLGFLYMVITLTTASIFSCSAAWISLFEANENAEIAKRSVGAADYSVELNRCPPTATDSSLKRYFSELTGEPVMEVIIAYDSGPLIRLYQRRAKIIHRLWKAAARVYQLREQLRKAEHESLQVAFNEHENIVNIASSTGVDESGPEGEQAEKTDSHPLEKRISFSRALRDEDDARITSELNALMNFEGVRDRLSVNFELVGRSHSALQVAVRKYDKLYEEFEAIQEKRAEMKAGTKPMTAFITFETEVGALRCLDLAENIRMHDQVVKVNRAPPPSLVIWENLEFSKLNRVARRSLTTTFAVVCIIFSFLISYALTYARELFREELTTAQCILPQNATSIEDLDDDLVQECACGLLTFSEAAAAVLNSSDPCHSFWFRKAPFFAYSFLLSLVIAVSNLAIRAVLQGLSSFEKHKNVLSLERSLTVRIFWTLLLNTGAVVYLVNFDVSVLGNVESPFGVRGYRDFNAAWFSDVGVQIIFILVINIAAPHASTVMNVIYVHLLKRNSCRNASSQRELNEWFLGPSFTLSYRIAQNLVTIMVTMAYSPGMPLLFPIAMLCFLVYYWVDKFLLLRWYRTPPRFDSTIARTASNLFVLAPIFQIFFAVWVYSAPGLFWFPQEDDFTDTGPLGNAISFVFPQNVPDVVLLIRRRLTLKFITPLLCFLIVYIVCLVLFANFRGFKWLVEAFLNRISCGFVNRHKIRTVELHPPLREAIRRQLVRGISSYAILKNPVYASAFGVDESFTRRHSHFESLQEISDQLPSVPRV